MEPLETPASGSSSVPEQGDAAQRKLAEIWGGHEPADNPEPLAEEPADASRQSQKEARDRSRNDAQRRLAAIWSTHPAEVAERQPPAAAQRVRDDAVLDRLTARVGERSAAVGPDDPQTIDARLELASTQLERGRTNDSVSELLLALEAIDKNDPAQAHRLVSARTMLARAYLVARRPKLAITLYEQLLGDESGAVTEHERLGYRIKLATAHRANGNVVTAVEQLESLVSELRATHETEDLQLGALIELGTSHVVAGRPRDGAHIHELGLSIANDVLGTGHRTTLGIRVMLARAYQQAGQSALAIRTYQQIVLDSERALGANDRLTTQAQSELTVLLRTKR